MHTCYIEDNVLPVLYVTKKEFRHSFGLIYVGNFYFRNKKLSFSLECLYNFAITVPIAMHSVTYSKNEIFNKSMILQNV